MHFTAAESQDRHWPQGKYTGPMHSLSTQGSCLVLRTLCSISYQDSALNEHMPMQSHVIHEDVCQIPAWPASASVLITYLALHQARLLHWATSMGWNMTRLVQARALSTSAVETKDFCWTVWQGHIRDFRQFFESLPSLHPGSCILQERFAGQRETGNLENINKTQHSH